MSEENITYLTQNEKNNLFKCIDASDHKNSLRDRTIIKIAYYCALRASELRILKLEDFNPDTKELKCNRIQNGKSNIIKIVDNDIYNDINKYYQMRKKDKYSSEYLFISQQDNPISRITLNNIAKKYLQKANVPKYKNYFQILRYTRVIDLLDEGFSLENIIWWTGLSQVTSSHIYQLFLSKTVSNINSIQADAYDILERGKNGKKKEENIKSD